MVRMNRKPTIKASRHGVKGNRWTAYDVKVNGKNYHHQSKTTALRQFKAAMRVYKLLKKKR